MFTGRISPLKSLSKMTSLPLLREGLLCHALDNQILVYDSENDKIHLLDETTGAVVEWMQKGETAEVIATRLEERTQTDRGEDLLALALDELANADLMQNSVTDSVVIPEVTRRRMLAGFASIGAALLVPTIISLTPSTAGAQASLACGAPCVTTASCPGTTRITCHCCKIGGNTDGTCSTELSGNCQAV